MVTTLTPDSPCTASITPDDNGGMLVELFVPTYGGGATFTLHAERDNDGDWRVFIPWADPESIDSRGIGDLDGMEVSNGILYLGAPDVPVEASA